ncbi:unnamed protein product [Gongylonema pulchrum]|uniref:Uncharacterized protein n=1 Tax=Gongylonema pulchrum TaxID=637853 RepID=A0A3P6R6F2_9BILA|nr:unnamed protein product [Gongylonema pulchrum]
MLEHGIVVLKPRETYMLHVVFEPKLCAFFRNVLQISVLNAECIKYSVRIFFGLITVPLHGSGGVAALRVLAQPELQMLRDGDAFLRLIVLDKETKKPVKGSVVTPSDCVCILRRGTQVFQSFLLR